MDHNTSQFEGETREERPKGSSSPNIVRTILIILVLAAIGFVAWKFLGDSNQEAVAQVNGETITRSEYNQAVENLRQSQQQSPTGGAVSDEQIRSQALEGLINQALIMSALEESSVSVSDEEVNTRLEQIKGQMQSEEAYQQQLEAEGLTEAELRDDIRTQLRMQAFIESELPEGSTTVTDEELQSAYDSYTQSAQSPSDVPSFAELEDTLRSQLQNVKINQGLPGILSDLRANADIEIFIDQPQPQQQPQPQPQQAPNAPTNTVSPDGQQETEGETQTETSQQDNDSGSETESENGSGDQEQDPENNTEESEEQS